MAPGSDRPALAAGTGVEPGPDVGEPGPGVWVVIARHPGEGGRGRERTEVVAAYSDLRWAMARVRTAGSSYYIVRAPLDPPL